MTEPQLIFISGASRSGTTLLSFVLRNHPEVMGLEELHYFGEAWDPREAERRFSRAEAIEVVAEMLARQDQGVLVRRIGTTHRDDARALVDALGPAASDPASVYVAVVQRLALLAGKSIPCEQTPRYIFYAQQLLDIFPSAHIVHIVRDPRAVMASQKHRWRRRRLAAAGAKIPRYESFRVWVNYHPYTVAWLWSRASSVALALQNHPRVTLLRFEDLVQFPDRTVRELCGRLGLSYDERMLDVGQVNSSHQSSAAGVRKGLQADAIDRWKESLTATEILVTERYCGPLMRRFGYPTATDQRSTPAGQWGLRLRYLVHLGGVLLVNPRRARIQAKALLRPRPAPRPDGPGPGGSVSVSTAAARPIQKIGVNKSENEHLRLQADAPLASELREFLGLRFWDVDLARAARFITGKALAAEPLRVYFVNAHCVNVAARDASYAQLLTDAPFVFADGVGMALAARLSGVSLHNNVNGTDLFPHICEAAAARAIPIGLLGARPGVARACAERMQRQYPGLNIVWSEHGYLPEADERSRIEELNASGAKILFVAKGVPTQEHWIAQHAGRLAAPVVLGVGALFDFYSGQVSRAPRLMRGLRMEWLYRLMLEPRRLSRRYLVGNPAFIARTVLWRTFSL